jgi:hypothetical protein
MTHARPLRHDRMKSTSCGDRRARLTLTPVKTFCRFTILADTLILSPPVFPRVGDRCPP